MLHPQELVQRYEPQYTPKWYAERYNYLGASELHQLFALTARSTAKPLLRLLRDKLLPREVGRTHEIGGDTAASRGHEDEQPLVDVLLGQLCGAAHLRHRYCVPGTVFEPGRHVLPIYEGQPPEEHSMRIAASLDRLIWDDIGKCWVAVECKSRQFNNTARYPTMPQYLQMQQQMACSETKLCWYVCANVRQQQSLPKCAAVYFDDDVWNGLLQPAAERFCKRVESRRRNYELLDPDDDKWAQLEIDRSRGIHDVSMILTRSYERSVFPLYFSSGVEHRLPVKCTEFH